MAFAKACIDNQLVNVEKLDTVLANAGKYIKNNIFKDCAFYKLSLYIVKEILLPDVQDVLVLPVLVDAQDVLVAPEDLSVLVVVVLTLVLVQTMVVVQEIVLLAQKSLLAEIVQIAKVEIESPRNQHDVKSLSSTPK